MSTSSSSLTSSLSPLSPLAPNPLPQAREVPGVEFFVGQSGIKYTGRNDLFLATFAPSTTAAASFTTNQVVGAPVLWTRDRAVRDRPRALIVNAGNANVATGEQGNKTVAQVAEALAQMLAIDPAEVWQASTGVIGEPLDSQPLITTARAAHIRSSSTIDQAAAACLTTDTFAKMASRVVMQDGHPITVSGFAKGSGMIEPHMATLLAFAFTDARIAPEDLVAMHQRAVAESLNAITVDGDTSTSDMALTFATGIGPQVRDLAVFEAALCEVYTELAQLVVRDGEGASKFIEIRLTNASSPESAKRLAFAVANSPLVKTALAGEDANWGRLMMALGKAGVPFDPLHVRIAIGQIPIVENGCRNPGYDEAPVAAYLKGDHIDISISMGAGDGSFTVWTCDLTHEYISINADYRS